MEGEKQEPCQMVLFTELTGGTDRSNIQFLKLPDPWPAPQPMFFPSLGLEVAKWFHEEGMAERKLIGHVRNKLIKRDECFLDIGAHVGCYTMACAPLAAHTFSFECSPRTFCYLAANVALHDLTDKVSLFDTALGSVNSSVDYIHRSKDGGGSGIQELSPSDAGLPRQRVLVRRLDDLGIDFPARIGLIKMDVEGSEVEVLRGAHETLVSHRWPPILFESWGSWKTDVQAEALRATLFSHLSGLGYVIHDLGLLQYDMFLAEKPPTGSPEVASKKED